MLLICVCLSGCLFVCVVVAHTYNSTAVFTHHSREEVIKYWNSLTSVPDAGLFWRIPSPLQDRDFLPNFSVALDLWSILFWCRVFSRELSNAHQIATDRILSTYELNCVTCCLTLLQRWSWGNWWTILTSCLPMELHNTCVSSTNVDWSDCTRESRTLQSPWNVIISHFDIIITWYVWVVAFCCGHYSPGQILYHRLCQRTFLLCGHYSPCHILSYHCLCQLTFLFVTCVAFALLFLFFHINHTSHQPQKKKVIDATSSIGLSNGKCMYVTFLASKSQQIAI